MNFRLGVYRQYFLCCYHGYIWDSHTPSKVIYTSALVQETQFLIP
jgi:hypothetical protein